MPDVVGPALYARVRPGIEAALWAPPINFLPPAAR
jgi:hypothetical protein